MIRHLEEIPQSSPLTASQLGIYLECIRDPDSTKYNVNFSFPLPAGTDSKRLLEAAKTVIRKHKVFSLTFSMPDGVPTMFCRDREVRATEETVSCLEDAINGISRPFDLEKGPLYRLKLVHAPGGDTLLFSVHHLIFDGSCIGIFLRHISQVYAGGECPDEALTQFDIAAAETEAPDPDRRAYYGKLFDEKFGGIDTDSKPVPDQILPDVPGRLLSFDLSAEKYFTSEEVSAFVSANHITENALFLGSFGYTLAKINGTSGCFFATAHTGRTDKGFSDSIGLFVKTLPFTVAFTENMAPAELLASAYEDYYQIRKNDCFSFAELAERYGFRMEVSFVYQSELFRSVPFCGGSTKVSMKLADDPIQSLECMLMKDDDDYHLHIYYDGSEYTRDFIHSFAKLYLNIVRGMLTKASLREICLADAEDRELLRQNNRTETDYPHDKTVVELFREQAAADPDAECLVFESKHYTYGEIDSMTDRLAKYLRLRGVEKDRFVGILIPRCEYMLIAALGVLKAGGAYLPLDPSYPPERLNLMMQDSGAMMLITTPRLSSVITGAFDGPRLMTDDIQTLEETDVSLPEPSPDDLFIMLYTSGSTGTPKGVMFAHGNTMVTAAWERSFYSLGPGSRVIAYASYGFDANVFETYATITSGAALHIISDEIRLDLPALLRYFNENGVTHAAITTQVGRQIALMPGLKTLKYLSVAGEKLTPLAPPEGIRLFNLYGPTEGSVLATAFEIERLYKDVPIGKAIDNVKLYVVDPEGRLLPPGAVGELWISGAHVTVGYRNRPEKTKEAYGLNPFCDEKGYERVYRTGDIVRMAKDSTIQFIGRRDAQVKVRGFRVELTEIEEVIRRFPGINDATVAAFDDPAGGKFIAAYVVSDSEIDESALGAFIRAEKPPYMVPAVVMRIEKIPLNQNHKVNRRALPRPERRAGDVVLPENETQKAICDIIAEIIGHSAFGVDTDLYEAGLTSIGTLKLNAALAQRFDTAIRFDDIRKNSTVRQLAEFLLTASKSVIHEKLTDYPLTQTQQGIFIECSRRPESVTYNIPLLLRLSPFVDTERLASAVCAALDAHPYSKAILFADEGGTIRARRRDDAKAEISVLEQEALPEPAALVRPYKLLGSPLYRAEIYKTPGGNYLYLDFHHIISDGVSETILLRDIDLAYAGKIPGTEQYTGFDFALDEETARSSPAYENARSYYDGIFRSCETECLPPRSATGSESGKASVITRCAADVSAVKAFCEKNKLTLNAFFNAAFGFTLSRFGQFEDTVYTTIYNGRSDSRLSGTLAMLVKTLPVLQHTSKDGRIVDFIRETQEQLINSMANDLYSFAEISSAYGIRSDILFVYQGDSFAFDSLCGYPAEMIDVPLDAAKAQLTLCVNLKDGAFEFSADYLREYCRESFVSAFLDAFSCVICSFCQRNELHEISLLSPAAEQKLSQINDTKRDYEALALSTLFERQVALHPERTAVISNGRSLSYEELNRSANRIAHALISAGVKKDVIVGMMIERGVEISAIELGILKAGGAFLGLLPSYPDDRIDFCLHDAECPVVVTTEAILKDRSSLFTKDAPYRVLTLESLSDSENDDDPGLDITPDSLAYCIYTSGSTGKPKGVMIEQRGVACCAQPAEFDNSYYFGPEGGDVALAISALSFDMSVIDNLLCLINGKTVCIATDREIHNPIALAKLITDNRVTDIVMTPSSITNNLAAPEFRDALRGVKTLISGAEVFPGSLYTLLRDLSPEMHIINGYGPTECTITCSAKLLTSDKGITIGGPTANTEFYVLDRFGNILPPYGCGELIICGDQVGRGYIKLPEKTNASFFTLNGRRAYHSGDTVRLNADGEVEFFGRADNQVKLRGYRVELDEIEKVICAFEGIHQSKVIVRNNGSEDFLAGFYTADRAIDPDALNAFLKTKLTYYMVPDVMAQLDQMPLTPSGKIDKKALPEIRREARRSGRRTPKKSTEELLCEIFKSTLSLDEFYADDNFFELGGTSLTASKAIMQLMSKGIEVEYQDIFDHPTPESLAEHIDALRSAAAPAQEKQEDSTEDRIREILKNNTLAKASEVKREPLGDVLLTGAVGFLGIHVLRELLENNEGRIICLVRKGDLATPAVRLKNMLMYYFGEPFEKALEERITVLDADITDGNLGETLSGMHFDTLINCAACVKHYAADDTIERINVRGVENLIRVAKQKSARMIQVSTVSVPGVHTQETYLRQLRMHEDELFVVDAMDNKYCISKYHAELKMLEAIQNGLRGKIIRVGNLMGRYSDGEFQINFNTNAFLHALRGFATIGKSPISHATDPMSFSPVDLTARAIVLLAGTNDCFTAFHADNRFHFDEMQLIDACNRCGITIRPVPDEEYYADYYRMLGDERVNSRLSGLVTNDRPGLHMVDTDNVFTANVLYRLGFSWPLIDSAYLERTINSLITLDYFDMDDLPEDL